MRILFYDCFAGISGDMNLGAMIDLGVEPGHLKSELAKLNISGFSLFIEKAERKGISGTLVTVKVESPDNEKHRHLRHVRTIINGSSLSQNVKNIALKIFQVIAEAEAKVHNIDIQQVHFHEVGALDSIADIVGAAICLDYLKVDRVLSSPIQLGGGTVKCAHGVMPVPAPATALIVQNIPVKTGLVQHEATTPTGAAILAATVDEFTENIPLPIIKTAYGIGRRDVPDVPNILRLYLLEPAEPPVGASIQDALVLECNIDDMNPEHYEFLMDKLLNAGASDVWFTPIIMKKSRPASIVSLLCTPEKADMLKAILFENTTTLGVRESGVTKTTLKRKVMVVGTRFGKVCVKECFFKGKSLRYKPEYEDCKKLALQHNVTIKVIENEVLKCMGNAD